MFLTTGTTSITGPLKSCDNQALSIELRSCENQALSIELITVPSGLGWGPLVLSDSDSAWRAGEAIAACCVLIPRNMEPAKKFTHTKNTIILNHKHH